MDFSNIHPVILCNDAATQLWPVSRKSHPVQFGNLAGEGSLLQSTLKQLSRLKTGRPLLIAANEYRFVVGEQLKATGIKGDVVIEPSSRNSAAAIAAAAEIIAATDPSAMLLVVPPDCRIGADVSFEKALSGAVEAAQSGKLVVFGTTPDQPDTQACYIELETKPDGTLTALGYKGIVDRPKQAFLKEIIASKRCLQNSSIYLFSISSLLAEFQAHAPHILEAVRAAVKSGVQDPDFFRIDQAYEEVKDDTIIHAVLRKSAGVVVQIPEELKSISSWKDVWQRSIRDTDGMARDGFVTDIGCKDTLLRAEHDQMRLVGVGLKGIVAIAMRDAVLVANMDHAEEMEKAIAQMKAEDVVQAEEFSRCFRPWGWYESLAVGPRFQVKEIMVKPGGVLSLQSHKCRSEHWTVVSGVAEVTVDDDVKMLGENESVYIPLGAVHRMANPHEEDMHLIEVQCGSYLGEDDIIRYEDIYART